jgi:hypothetical protein
VIAVAAFISAHQSAPAVENATVKRVNLIGLLPLSIYSGSRIRQQKLQEINKSTNLQA